jgi:hypothetical protein
MNNVMNHSLHDIANEIAHFINGRVIKDKAASRFGSIASLPESYCAMGKYRDRAIFINLTPWGEHSIQCDCNIGVCFTIKKKTWINRINIFTRKNVKIGDHRLDTLFDVHCNDKRFIKVWLLDTDARGLLIKTMPFNRLAFAGKVLKCDIDQPLEKVSAPNFISKTETLSKIAETLERTAGLETGRGIRGQD